MNLKLCFMKEVNHKMTHTVLIHVLELSRTDKSRIGSNCYLWGGNEDRQ